MFNQIPSTAPLWTVQNYGFAKAKGLLLNWLTPNLEPCMRLQDVFWRFAAFRHSISPGGHKLNQSCRLCETFKLCDLFYFFGKSEVIMWHCILGKLWYESGKLKQRSRLHYFKWEGSQPLTIIANIGTHEFQNQDSFGSIWGPWKKIIIHRHKLIRWCNQLFCQMESGWGWREKTYYFLKVVWSPGHSWPRRACIRCFCS